jgi:hypothetical protein
MRPIHKRKANPLSDPKVINCHKVARFEHLFPKVALFIPIVLPVVIADFLSILSKRFYALD